MGAFHALEPGHGKTLVAAYLVGSRGTMRQALFLGGVVTFTHTASVFALGLATLFLTQYIAVEKISPVLSVISGLTIVAVGAFLLITRWRHWRVHRHRGHHHHHHHNHDHHHHMPEDVSAGSLIALGASGGLVPCPAALVLLLTAVSLGRIPEGIVLLLSFSLGLALVLVGVGAFVLYAKKVAPSKHSHGHHAGWLPIASAAVILSIGVLMTTAAITR